MSISHQKFEENEVRVLIVDDDKNFAEGLSNFLEKFNISTIIENRITSAEKKLRRSTFDVVLLDVMMPGMDGLEVARRIREIEPNQIIIVISASNDLDKISEAMRIGVNSFIQKPIDTQKILDMLSNLNDIVAKKRKIETKTFSISLPLDLYDLVHANAKAESISKNAVIIRSLRTFYDV